MEESLYIVGPGRMGLALGHALDNAGAIRALTYCGRRPDPPAHPLFIHGRARYVFGIEPPEPGTTAVILAVPDELLLEIAVTVAAQGAGPSGCSAFHLSGALGTDPLAPLVEAGYSVGTLHPLQTVADPVFGASQLEGITFAVSGDPAALSTARRLLDPLGARSVHVPVSRRPLYHAAAVFSSNYLAGLMAAAGRLMVQAGLPEEEGLRAILPLARGTLENLARMDPARALTGPVSRGDVETVRLHLRVLEPRERTLYASMGLDVLELAVEGGLDQAIAEELREIFEREQ